MISVSASSSSPDESTEWYDFIARAQPNVFMTPALLDAAQEDGFSHITVLLARDEKQMLVGAWALRHRHVFGVRYGSLDGLPFDYAFQSTPIVDPQRAHDVMDAFLAKIASDRLGRALRLRSFVGQGQAFGALQAAVKRAGGRIVVVDEISRPFVSTAQPLALSSDRRKKSRQCWRRLRENAPAETRLETAPDAVVDAFENFLALERSSWKGRKGTALLCREADAAFARRAIRCLASRGQSAMLTLVIEGKVIAVQVVLLAGRTAYTWKIAFDEAYAQYSPGALLIEALPEQLFATGKYDLIDSCAGPGFMDVWPGRLRMVDLIVATKSVTSPAFLWEYGWQSLRQRLRNMRDFLFPKLQWHILK